MQVMIVNVHVPVKTEGAVAVGSSALILPSKPFGFFSNIGKSGGEVYSHSPA